MFGPTTGDKVRLGDTDILIEVKRDATILGEEVKFGGGKVIRDGMGQSQLTRAQGAADTVITNRSEEHTSELQSLMRISYAVFCLKKKKKYNINRHRTKERIIDDKRP